MFYDERIHAAKGKAFRKTLIFACILFCAYTVLHIGYLIVMRPEPDSMSISLLFELCMCAVGGAILTVGETRFPKADEREAGEKNRYYAKNFYHFLYAAAGLYCVLAPLAAYFRPFEDFAPNGVLQLALIPCWLYLLLQFKTDEVPLNPEFIGEEKHTYYRRVWNGILKFGGMCFGFTLVSEVVLFFCSAVTGSFVFSLAAVLGVLLAGLLTWVSFSLEYLIFSIAERSSDRAKQEGRISGAVRAFLWIWIALSLLMLIVTAAQRSVLTGDFPVLPDVPLGQKAASFSYLNKGTGTLVGYFLSLFVVYLFSETRRIGDKKIGSVLTVILFVQIAEFLWSFLTPYLLGVLSTYVQDVETFSRIAVPLNYAAFAVTALTCVLACIAVLRASRYGVTKPGDVVPFILRELFRIFESGIVLSFLGFPASDIVSVLLEGIPVVVIGIVLERAFRRIREENLLPKDAL